MQSYSAVPLTFFFPGPNVKVTSYKRREELGRGGFAAVYRVQESETGQDFAIKVINKSKYTKPKSIEKLKGEISIQSSLNHPNVLRSFGHYEDSRYHYILLEYCPGKSVRDMVRGSRRLPEKKVVEITKDILSGVCYLHDNRIIHRDLKLENYLVGADGKIKVADFGLSAKLDYDDEKKFTVCGTPNYLCPEILRSKGHSYEVDVWAIGVSVYVMLFGKQPFDCIKTKLLYEHIKNGNYVIPIEPQVSKNAKEFIKSTLQINPNLRPSVQQLLCHPFITGGQFTAIVPQKPIVSHKPITERPALLAEVPKKHENVLDNPIVNDAVDGPVHVGEETTIPKYFVSRFCDDSKRTGLSYLLADGTVGMITKENERWIMDPHEEFIQFYRDYYVTEPELIDPLLSSEPMVATLKKFSKLLKKLTSMFTLPDVRYDKNVPLAHVKYWLRSDNATLFRMDQRDVQVNFDDKVKVAYFPHTKRMMMVTNLKEKTRAILTDSLKASHSLSEEKRRFEMVRELIIKLSKTKI